MTEQLRDAKELNKMKSHLHNMTIKKMNRKIWYLRGTNKPNVKDGATKYSWRTYWNILHKLQLAKKLHYSF